MAHSVPSGGFHFSICHSNWDAKHLQNSFKGNSPQWLEIQYVQELDLRKSLKKPFLHRPSFCNDFIPRIKHIFLPLMASHHRCRRTELGSSTELPCWLKISLRIWWRFKIPRYFFKQINEILILQILTWTNYRFIQVKSRTEKWTRFGSQTDLDLNLASDR